MRTRRCHQIFNKATWVLIFNRKLSSFSSTGLHNCQYIFFCFLFLFPARGIIRLRSSLRWGIGIPSFLWSLKKLYTGDEELKFVLKYFGWIAQLLLAKDTWLYSTHITIGLSNGKRNCIVDILWLQIPIPVNKASCVKIISPRETRRSVNHNLPCFSFLRLGRYKADRQLSWCMQQGCAQRPL